VQTRLGGTPVPKKRKKKTVKQICDERGWEIGICPKCKCPMRVVELLKPSRAPPSSVPNSRTAHSKTVFS